MAGTNQAWPCGLSAGAENNQDAVMIDCQIMDRERPGEAAEAEEGSIAVTEEAFVRRFTDNPDFPYLISFPRTGSHWLRMLMELYFEKPSLVRAFYYKNPEDFTCYHWHDEDLRLRRRNVIYLYRHPVATIYSQLSYYKEDHNDPARIAYWSTLYGQHLKKWLMTDNFTTKKTVVTYEGLKTRLSGAFENICLHFGVPFDETKLLAVNDQVTKANLKRKTNHDIQVVDLSRSYELGRQVFQDKHTGFVMQIVLAQHKALSSLFAAS
jgi:hypothetical protein